MPGGGGEEVADFDYAVITYTWTNVDGKDLDTRTYVKNPDRRANAVGWKRLGSDLSYLTWGGDNQVAGTEAALIDMKNIVTDFPLESVIEIGLNAFWYSSVLAGKVKVAFTSYKGGSMVKSGYSWINEGGSLVQDLSVDTQTLLQNATDIDGELLATLIFNPLTKTGVLRKPSDSTIPLPPAEPSGDIRMNDIGVQGAALFGVGITDALPPGMSEMTGTRTVGHENYGNYQHTDGSIMCWIPRFYYRWGGADSPRAATYGLNSLDVKSIYDFKDVAAANAAGYAVHRAFYDDGQLKNGFFVDKYQASNNTGVASSLKNGIPLSSSSSNAPFSGLNSTPANTYAGAIDAVKTRGAAFFVTTLFVQRALSLLSMAHAQAATSTDNCAWYDATGVANYPKGCNNDALGDVNDATVKYTATGYLKAGKTGSALPFAKTTHNGQANGVADLNGNMYEICLGVTQSAGTFYALKTTAKASTLTSGATTASDAWGAAGIAANYESLGTSIGALTGVSRGMIIGSGTQQVFSAATSGKKWQASCAGIPLASGVDAIGTDLFGHDRFHDDRIADMCPRSGGSWYDGALSGVWCVHLPYSRAYSSTNVGVRAALYSV